MNTTIISVLKKLSTQYNKDPNKNSHQRNALKKAIKAVSDYDDIITDKKEALKIKGIGEGIAKKIEEILKTGTLSILDAKIDDSYNILKSITGVGPQKAKKLIKEGITSVDSLRKAVEGGMKITEHIEIGLRYYDDFNLRIPRDEIDEYNIYLKKVLSDYIFHIAGSYRRQNKDSGDIDILITHKDIKEDKDITKLKVMPKILTLISDSLLKDGMLTPKATKKFMGTCKIRKHARRIDIRLVKCRSYFPALMYFTGSMEYNIYCRNIAIEKGLLLNEYGLFRDKEELIVNSEEDICKLLEIEYKEPKDRMM